MKKRSNSKKIPLKKADPFAFFTFTVMFTSTIYMVFFHEFTAKDHCYMPIRRFVARRKAEFLNFIGRNEKIDYGAQNSDSKNSEKFETDK